MIDPESLDLLSQANVANNHNDVLAMSSENSLVEPACSDESSEVLRQYKLQEKLYASNNTGLVCTDTVKRVRDYVGNQTYRHVKFTSETGKEFDEPDFVGGMKTLSSGGTAKIQCIEICQYLMKKIGKSCHVCCCYCLQRDLTIIY